MDIIYAFLLAIRVFTAFHSFSVQRFLHKMQYSPNAESLKKLVSRSQSVETAAVSVNFPPSRSALGSVPTTDLSLSAVRVGGRERRVGEGEGWEEIKKGRVHDGYNWGDTGAIGDLQIRKMGVSPYICCLAYIFVQHW